MEARAVDRERIRGAWEGRISGCILGKPLEPLSIFKGREALRSYLEKNQAWPLRNYVPLAEEPLVQLVGSKSCQGLIRRSEPDDDINYTVLALMMLETHGLELSTHRVADAWLRLLPAGVTYTAERAAYQKLLEITNYFEIIGVPADIDLSPCAHNEWSEWIGAQIRADLFGWVCPGQPRLAADLARRDAALSHTGEGIHAAAFVAALAAAIPASTSLAEAMDAATAEVPSGSAVSEAIALGRSLAGRPDGVDRLHERYPELSPVHAVNNLALVVWGILNGEQDFSVAIGDTVSGGWDTDCNGATVGGLWGLTGKPIPPQWTAPWRGRVAVSLAGVGELAIEDLVDRTLAVARKFGSP
jgi:ADP-ribosylglycohydrolase